MGWGADLMAVVVHEKMLGPIPIIKGLNGKIKWIKEILGI